MTGHEEELIKDARCFSRASGVSQRDNRFGTDGMQGGSMNG